MERHWRYLANENAAVNRISLLWQSTNDGIIPAAQAVVLQAGRQAGRQADDVKHTLHTAGITMPS